MPSSWQNKGPFKEHYWEDRGFLILYSEIWSLPLRIGQIWMPHSKDWQNQSTPLCNVFYVLCSLFSAILVFLIRRICQKLGTPLEDWQNLGSSLWRMVKSRCFHPPTSNVRMVSKDIMLEKYHNGAQWFNKLCS